MSYGPSRWLREKKTRTSRAPYSAINVDTT